MTKLKMNTVFLLYNKCAEVVSFKFLHVKILGKHLLHLKHQVVKHYSDSIYFIESCGVFS